ncbi:hypothetical protein ASPZODRAFT_1803794 [Penicilliopsis zonata CBS 506.65]|uniref:Uncharacterized protein n=1 Tax=Penicilliopsis zonata CBS 506.65 TaxID=1073090 RepID=A0A1L9SLD4_9EURO|nr:hypothetical protein ASPZODRAFT_1803794 [Penicilliopsis zonata CBS 506.65]OJJ47887.1 hypothetical protein ASPZODRAFT_1803794 [Penicilliopsis zonata CBS 506.65]
MLDNCSQDRIAVYFFPINASLHMLLLIKSLFMIDLLSSILLRVFFINFLVYDSYVVACILRKKEFLGHSNLPFKLRTRNIFKDSYQALHEVSRFKPFGKLTSLE